MTAILPLTPEALDQVRAMLAAPVDATYDKNVQLLLGTARMLLATLDAQRAERQRAIEEVRGLPGHPHAEVGGDRYWIDRAAVLRSLGATDA